jgi:DNA-binding IclR family transcriptional regulator
VTSKRSLITIARPFLADLVAELGEDAGLGLPDGNEILYVDQVESDNPVQVRNWTGTRAPMHAVPSGLVLLAESPEDALAAYVRGGLAALTPRTMTDSAKLRKRLAEIRRQGYAWGLQEFAEGINSVAASVRDARGKAVAAVHVHGPAYRFPAAGSSEVISEQVVAAAKAIGVLLAGGSTAA